MAQTAAGKTWTAEDLRNEVGRYEKAIRDADMTPETVESYVNRANRFIAWLDGDWKPHHGEYPHESK